MVESTDVMKLNLNGELEMNIYLIWKGELVVVGRAVEITCLEAQVVCLGEQSSIRFKF